MKKPFVTRNRPHTHSLSRFVSLSQQTCHARGCHATGGMAPVVLPRDNPQCRQQITENVCM